MKAYSFLLLLCLFSSCSFYKGGSMTGNASITNANFRTVGLATGSASARYFFGISFFSSDGLVMDAKKNLYAQTVLKDGQALANVTVDFKIKLFLFWVKQTATISADIIDFNTPEFIAFDQIPRINPHDLVVQNLNQHKEENTNLSTAFSMNDLVFYSKKHDKTGKIIEINEEYIVLEVHDETGSIKYVKSNTDKLYFIKKFKNSKAYGIDDQVIFEDYYGLKVMGSIVGISENSYKIYSPINSTINTVKESEIFGHNE